jgi:hypothetical protein
MDAVCERQMNSFVGLNLVESAVYRLAGTESTRNVLASPASLAVHVAGKIKWPCSLSCSHRNWFSACLAPRLASTTFEIIFGIIS